MKTLKTAGTLALLVLAFPAAALAHTGSAIVSCTAADYHFSHFLAGANTVHYTVVADDVPVAHGDFALNQAGGTAGALHVPLALSGTHTVSAYAWWGPAGTVKRQTGGSYAVPMATQQMTCTPPPAVQVPAPPVAPVAPVATVPAVPAVAVAPVPAPAGAVLGQTVSSAARTARLGARAVCSTRAVQVTVVGRRMRDIAFSINGRHIRTIIVRSGQRSVTASLRMRNPRTAQVVAARVRFRNGAGPRVLTARTSRCAQVAVAPQFTG
jgi:hypothetical protein